MSTAGVHPLSSENQNLNINTSRRTFVPIGGNIKSTVETDVLDVPVLDATNLVIPNLLLGDPVQALVVGPEGTLLPPVYQEGIEPAPLLVYEEEQEDEDNIPLDEDVEENVEPEGRVDVRDDSAAGVAVEPDVILVKEGSVVDVDTRKVLEVAAGEEALEGLEERQQTRQVEVAAGEEA
ncbi:unnamed protein product, partial [Amoebophrya sp. A25]|eukprot:GSA25T00018374001.1